MGYSQFSTFAVYALIIWFGGYEVDKGHSTFEDMLKVRAAAGPSSLQHATHCLLGHAQGWRARSLPHTAQHTAVAPIPSY